jgi:hypothetical protein
LNRSRRLTLGAGLLCLGAGASLLGKQSGNDEDEPVPSPGELGKQQNVKIGWGDPATFYVPPYLPADAVVDRVAFKPVTPAGALDALRGIARAFRAYPPGCLGRIIRAIFIAGEIRVDGVVAGGTYWRDWIFVESSEDLRPRTRVLNVLIAVHHETSSHLWLPDTGLQQAFFALEPAHWQYAASTADAMRIGREQAPPLETGFISAYGSTSPENDFNTYAQTIFHEPARMKHLARAYPLIARKLALVLDAYIRVDDRLRETFSQNGLL